ncbi:hypothetical protein BDA99DRAFT_564204 [Phascolomyces articulosus]|uniref:Uncharacterized protein n=1 Tax=Phascolomyces articulosus TaxID=60185 RepID=A0AAD5P9G0_9FUNG|nr:hypothetical protein BDA99DRAFT_564204 [Phascolomyces articulosus]
MMGKDRHTEVPVAIPEKSKVLIRFIKFFATVAASTIKILMTRDISSVRRKSNTTSLAPNIVNPVIERLNEGKHMTTITDEGLMSVLGSIDHDQ